MISSVLLRLVLTAVFAGTAGYAVLRWASLRAGLGRHHGDQVAELSHLLMSVSMIAMVWAVGGHGADLVQLVVFGTFAGYFLLSLLGPAGARPGCPAAPFHVLMSAAMLWMVGVMALSMGSAASAADMPGMPGMTAAGGSTRISAPLPSWTSGVSALLALALVVAGLCWARHAVRRPGRELVPVGGGSTGTGSAPGRAGSANRLVDALTPRSDAICHCAMSLAMAVTFLPML